MSKPRRESITTAEVTGTGLRITEQCEDGTTRTIEIEGRAALDQLQWALNRIGEEANR